MAGWGGRREGSGRKPGGINKLAQSAIKKADEAEVHPVDFLLGCVADKDLPKKERASAAAALLPYVTSKLSIAEINVTHETDGMTDAELRQRADVLDQLILEHEPQTINGTAKRLENRQEVVI